MKNAVRAALCLLMAVMAAVAAGFTLAELASGTEETAQQAGESLYILGASEGLVAVYAGADTQHPLEVTGISLASLREGDRTLLARGLPVDSAEELAQLLEDLGS